MDLYTVCLCIAMLVLFSGVSGLVVLAIFVARKDGRDDESDWPVD